MVAGVHGDDCHGRWFVLHDQHTHRPILKDRYISSAYPKPHTSWQQPAALDG